MGNAQQCSYWREFKWPGHAAVLKRLRCRLRTKHPSGKCQHHRSYEPTTDRLLGEGQPPANDAAGQSAEGGV